MKDPITRWRRFVVQLGYSKSAILHCLVIMPLVWLGFWLLIFSAIPHVFGARIGVPPSAILTGPLSPLWIIPSLLLGILILPMCRLGLSAEPGFPSRGAVPRKIFPMRCLTDSEVSEWLRREEIQEDPYERGSVHDYYLQFRAPTADGHMDALVRHYWERIIPGSVAVVHMTDWGLYKPSEMTAVVGIRSTHGEKRALIEAAGHLIEPGEAEVGISLFALSASFEWTSYLYAPPARTTLLNWEGELFDFWTESREAYAEMRRLLAEFELAETCRSEAMPSDADKPSD